MCYVITFYAAILFLRGFCILICTYLHFYSFSRSFLYDISMPNAPNGAVMMMAMTATERMILPQPRPAARGTEPMAAWTVAFGR